MFLGEAPVYAREAGMGQHFAYVASGNGAGQLEYQGFSFPGEGGDTSLAKFAIRKFVYNSDNKTITILWGGGNDKFNQVWDDRETLTYT